MLKYFNKLLTFEAKSWLNVTSGKKTRNHFLLIDSENFSFKKFSSVVEVENVRAWTICLSKYVGIINLFIHSYGWLHIVLYLLYFVFVSWSNGKSWSKDIVHFALLFLR